MGQAWSPSADGGYFANSKLSKKLRYAAQPFMKFRQYPRPVDAFGKGQGDTVDYDKITNLQTQGGEIGEQQKVPETKFIIKRASITITEYGNSIPWTGKLELLSEFNINQPIQKVLRDDMSKVLDAAVATKFKLTKVSYSPVTSASGTWNWAGSPAAGTANFNLFHLKEIVDAMIEANVPPAVGGPEGDYVCIATQKALRGILDDPEFQEWNKYQNDRLLRGEVGRVYRTRFVLTTHTSALTKKASNAMGEAIIFGDDAVVEAIAQPEEVRAKTPDDYGRSKGLAWLFMGQWGHVWDYATDSEYRAVHVTSSSA